MPLKSPLKRRIAPSVPLTLNLVDADGSKFTRHFKLAFDTNVACRIFERTGVDICKSLEFLSQLNPVVLSTTFWAAAIDESPEYDTRDAKGEPTSKGLEFLRTYIDDENKEQIFEAVWQAYLHFVGVEKRKFLEGLMERARSKARGEEASFPEQDPTKPSAEQPTAVATSDGSSSGPSLDTTSVSLMARSAS